MGVRQDHGASALVREEEEVSMAPSEMAGLFVVRYVVRFFPACITAQYYQKIRVRDFVSNPLLALKFGGLAP